MKTQGVMGGILAVPQPLEGKVLRCTCKENGKDPLQVHSYMDGRLQPCPNGRVEYLGVLTEMTELIERFGCTSVEDFIAKHPYRWGMYQVKQLWKSGGSDVDAKLSFFNT